MIESNHNAHGSLAEFERQMTLVTAARPLAEELQGEAAELRQAWQALRQLLEAEQSPGDADALLAALRQAPLEEVAPIEPVARQAGARLDGSPRRAPWPWQIVTLLAFAAAVSGLWFSATGVPRPVDSAVAQPQTSLPSVAASPAAAQATPAAEVVSEGDLLAWDDSEFDTALDSVAAGLADAARPTQVANREADWLQHRFQQWQQDLNDEAL